MHRKQQYCSRCRDEITCRADDITQCDCYAVVLSEDTVQYLQETRYQCLCNACLRTVNNLTAIPPDPHGTMTEGLHYYMDNGNYVFTELYHIQRGYCCGNRCRHCAYGIHLKNQK